MIMVWVNYNHVLVNKSIINSNLNFDEMYHLLRTENVFMAKYITDFDMKSPTEWWYVIKDDKIDLSKMKSKYRNEINKGLNNATTRRINKREFKDEIHQLFMKVMKKRSQHKDRNLESMFVDRFEDPNELIEWWGVFLNDNDKLVAFAIVDSYEEYVDLREFFFDYDYLRYHISNSLVYTLCVYYLNEKNKRFISDGERSINHPTSIQDYLIRTFGFRKAYCTLHLVYKNTVIRNIVSFLWKVRNVLLFLNKSSLGKQINALMKLETIYRSFK